MAADKPEAMSSNPHSRLHMITAATPTLKVAILALLSLMLVSAFAKADIAPPFLHINVSYNGQPVNGTFYAEVLSCLNISSSTPHGFVPQLNVTQYNAHDACYWMYVGRGGGACKDGVCDFEFFESNLKVAFYLPSINKTYITNEATIEEFSRGYNTETDL